MMADTKQFAFTTPVFTLAVLFLIGGASAHGAEVWTGLDHTFAKANFADWTQPQNQDRITDSVWMTRKDTQGVFNIAVETGYQSGSPLGTEWAYGNAADWASLTFAAWVAWNGGNPQASVGRDAVVHLISDGIYLDIKFLSFTGGGNGGGFSYARAVPEPATLAFLVLGALGSVCHWKK